MVHAASLPFRRQERKQTAINSGTSRQAPIASRPSSRPVAEHRHGHQILGRALVASGLRSGNGSLPFAGIVIAPSQPGQGESSAASPTLRSPISSRSSSAVKSSRPFFGQAILCVGVARLVVHSNLLLVAALIVLVDGGADRARLIDEPAPCPARSSVPIPFRETSSLVAAPACWRMADHPCKRARRQAKAEGGDGDRSRLQGARGGLKCHRLALGPSMSLKPRPTSLAILLLRSSNIFLTPRLDGHLNFKTAPLATVVMVSWAIPFVESWLAVPANVSATRSYSAAQLRRAGSHHPVGLPRFSRYVYLKEALTWTHLAGLALIAAGADSSSGADPGR